VTGCCYLDDGDLYSRPSHRACEGMIKVVESYEFEKDTDTQPMFLKLRSYAMTFPGFISVDVHCSQILVWATEKLLRGLYPKSVEHQL
jgi:hypothetical protein